MEAGANSTTMLNMATTALLIATAAWARRESRGAHFRSDYPAENPNLADRTMTTLAQARDIAASLSDQAARAPRPALA
jgi:L-aspartate oxidase